MGTNFLVGPVAIGQILKRDGRCPIPGNIQSQVGWGSKQPDLVEDVPVHWRWVGLDDL